MAKQQSERAQRIRANRTPRPQCSKHGTVLSSTALYFRCGCPNK